VNDLASRVVARDALLRIDDGAYANLVLPALLERSKLDARDRRFVTELVYGTTRMRRALDAVLAPHLQREPEASVRCILRLGAYQLRFTEVPPHAAVSTTVSLAPKRAQGFVNAVLRRVADVRAAQPAVVGERLSYPDWIVDRLVADLGERDAIASLEAMNAAPPPHTRDDGYVQDPASGMVAELVDARRGDVVADLCAAPGGKATALGHTVAPDGLVVAADIRPGRVALIADNAHRTNTTDTVAAVVADGTSPPLRPGAFNRVLVDAPCSGLGVLHRRADARWRVQPDNVDELAALGQAILLAVAPLVAPDGVLVYSVCTLTTAETTAIEAPAGFEPLPPPPEPWRPRGDGALLLPQDRGTDGMFILRLRRS
jgi:16S rRNA (cytosine967-C5)-methyltransferase